MSNPNDLDGKNLSELVAKVEVGNDIITRNYSNCDFRGMPFIKNKLSSKVDKILDEEDDETIIHPVFCELIELRHSKKFETEVEWVETARWIKFEEDVEEDGERWSKPHVATLSLRAVYELKQSFECGTVMLDLDVDNFEDLVDALIHTMIEKENLDLDTAADISALLLSKHRHLYENSKSTNIHKIPFVKSIVDMSRKAGLTHKCTANSTSKVSDKDGKINSSTDDDKLRKKKLNEHYRKKIPEDAETGNILVGMVNFLERPVSAFVRLKNSTYLSDLTEVHVPTRFIYIILGPDDRRRCYHEMGRVMSTLLSDAVFHEIAYKAKNNNDYIIGVDEFLNQCTVLPPGEWDPNIRIEPPKNIPDQEQRKHISENQMNEADNEPQRDETLKRSGRIFGGLIADIKRKAPYYLSDYKDAISIQTISTIFFMYFACLTPAITFGELYSKETDGSIGIIESLLGIGICGVTFHIFSGQPLTILNCTGPILVFEGIMATACRKYQLEFLATRFWIGMWIMLLIFIIVAFDLSSLIIYITRFTEEIFSMLIAVIFCYEAINKLFQLKKMYMVKQGIDYTCWCFLKGGKCNKESITSFSYPNVVQLYNSYNDSVVSLPTNITGSAFIKPSQVDSISHFCTQAGGLLLDPNLKIINDENDQTVFYFSCLLFLGTFVISLYLKSFKSTRFFSNKVRNAITNFGIIIAIVTMVVMDIVCNYDTIKLKTPNQVVPTSGRNWIVNPLNAPLWMIAFAFVPASLAAILIFMDQQITSVIVNRKENQLKKGAGYHLDLLIVAVQIGIMSVVGFPWFVAATVLSISHVRSLSIDSPSAAPGEKPKFLGIREQRVTGICTFILVGLSVFFKPILNKVPLAVLYGVFLYMGVSSTIGLQLLQRIMIVFIPSKYQPDYMWLRHVPIRRIHLFTFLQILCFSVLWAVKKIEIVSIGFPLMILAIVFVRKLFDYLFSQHDLEWLDDRLPEIHKKKAKRKKSTESHISPNSESFIKLNKFKLRPKKNKDKKQRNKSEGSDSSNIDYLISMNPILKRSATKKRKLLENKYRKSEGCAHLLSENDNVMESVPKKNNVESTGERITFSVLGDDKKRQDTIPE